MPKQQPMLARATIYKLYGLFLGYPAFTWFCNHAAQGVRKQVAFTPTHAVTASVTPMLHISENGMLIAEYIEQQVLHGIIPALKC